MMLDGILASGAIERELESLVGAEAAVDDAATSPARLPFAQHGPAVDPGREGADPRRTPRRAASEARRGGRSGPLAIRPVGVLSSRLRGLRVAQRARRRE